MTTTYTTASELSEVLEMSDSVEAPQLEAAVLAASRQIDDHCGRRFYQDTNPVARYYWPDDECELLVDDIATTTALAVAVDDGTGTYATTLTVNVDFLVAPVNALADDWPITKLLTIENAWTIGARRPSVKVTATYGWPSVPAQVETACLIQAKNLYKAPSGTLVGFQSAGIDAGVVRLPPLDPTALALLQRFVREAT